MSKDDILKDPEHFGTCICGEKITDDYCCDWHLLRLRIKKQFKIPKKE